MKLNLQTVSFAADAMRMLNGARLSVSGIYSITGVDSLIAAGINFSSTTALMFADLEGLPSNNTMGPVNARPLQDVKLNHDEGESRRETWKISDNKGADWTTCEDVQAAENTPRSRERKSIPETSESGR